MKNIIDQDVLKLNKNWQVIGIVKVRTAFEGMCNGSLTALNCDEELMIPCRMKDWINLPIRDNDDVIHTSTLRIRVPRVVIAVKFDKLIIKPPKLTLKNLRKRDKDTCIYTGKKLKEAEMSIEHIIPQSMGGSTEWTNVALADKNINSKRGNRPLDEIGLELRYQPFAPKPVAPADSIEIKQRYPEWDIFLKA